MKKETFDSEGNVTYGDGLHAFGMSRLFHSNPLPNNIKDFEDLYPMAYKYIILKRPSKIVFEATSVVLRYLNDVYIAYDIEDIDLFNQLTEEMFPKLID